MNSPVSGRNQRSPPILSKLKQGIQFVFLVAFCVWLVYRVHHLHAHRINSDPSSYDHIAGRKVNLGRLTLTHGFDVGRVVFHDITGIRLTKSQEEYFVEKGKGSRGDSAKSRNHLQLVQGKQGISETSMHVTPESLINEVKEGRSKAEVDKSSSIKDIAVLGLADKNGELTDRVYIHPKHHLTEEYHHGVFDDENGVPPGLTESRNYE